MLAAGSSDSGGIAFMKSGLPLRPLRYATCSALTYLVISGGYIVFSGELAANASASTQDLQRLETIKGLLFVVSSAAVIFALAYVLVRRIAERTRQLLQHQQALMIAERRALAGVLASTVAHDFNNLLTVVGSGLDVLAAEEGPRSEADRELLEDMQHAVERGTTLAERLHRAGRNEIPDERRQVDLVELARETLRLVRAHPMLRHARVKVTGAGAVKAEAYPTLVHQILINLLVNAGEAVGGRGRVEVRIHQEDGLPRLEVHDDGPGISEAARERMFEPFYTTKESGTGLGMVSVRVCAARHGGEVQIDTSDLGGACFRVRLGPMPENAELSEETASPFSGARRAAPRSA